MLVTSQALAFDPVRDGRMALRGSRAQLTHCDLRAQAQLVADASATWSGHDDGRSPYVAMLSDWTPQFVACFLGLASAGWAVGVLDPAWSDHELAGALAQLDPSVVVVADECHGSLTALATWGWRESGRVDPGWTVMANGTPSITRAPPSPHPDGPFYVGFTSGSSGRPKAFVRSHRSWWESFERFGELCPIDAARPVLVPGPLSSSHFLFGALHALHGGACVELVTAAEYSPETVARRLDLADPLSAMYVVPTMLARQADGSAGPAAAAPDYLFCAGARLDAAVRERARRRFPATRVVEYYGASELSFVAIRIDGDGTPQGAVGRGFPGVEVTIRDEHDTEVAPGRPGVVFARSALTFMGYRGETPRSGARALEGGWLTVGDRGTLDADGYLRIEGRGSSLIITGGANVQPEEVEQVVAGCPGIAECVVVGMPDPTWGEIVCAVVTLERGREPARTDLRRHVGARLARYKRPRRYVVLDGSFPLGRSGKIDRSAVRERVSRGGATELR